MDDETDKDEEAGRPFTPRERKELREMLENYERSQWLFELTLKVGKWAGAITALAALYHLLRPQLPK